MEAVQGSSLKDEANNTKDIRAEVVITKLHETEVSKAKIVLAIDNLYFFTVSLPEIKTAFSLNLLTSQERASDRSQNFRISAINPKIFHL